MKPAARSAAITLAAVLVVLAGLRNSADWAQEHRSRHARPSGSADEAESGEVRLRLNAYGPFTVGAEMTEATVYLELDLAAENLPPGVLDVSGLTPERLRHFRVT